MLLNVMRSDEKFPFELPKLPYDESALEPYMSAKTFSFHYHKHHQTYVTKLNEFLKGSDLEKYNLEEIIIISGSDKSRAAIFNNAAQVWNHTFFWHCMKKDGGGAPAPVLMEKFKSSFGSFEKFKEEFKTAAISQFGSGWAWLVQNQDGKLEIMKTSNADLPMLHSKKALLTVDVWEHAYYLDYQNKRPDYVDVFLNHLVNWDFVQNSLAK